MQVDESALGALEKKIADLVASDKQKIDELANLVQAWCVIIENRASYIKSEIEHLMKL